MRFKGAAWGYRIDYDQAIAEDERQLALLARLAELGLYTPDDAEPGICWRWIDVLLLRDPDRRIATALELTETDLAALVAYFEIEPAKYGLGEAPAGWYRRADEIAKRLDWVEASFGSLPTRAQAEARRKHAKAALARHKRNKVKWGSDR